MIIRKMRLDKGWSQEQLAEISGLSVRTIQRIEHGRSIGLESLKSLAAVFETDLSTLREELNMQVDDCISTEEKEILAQVRDIKGFYGHLIQYAVVIGFLFAINLFVNPKVLWAGWAAMGWGIGLLVHGLSVFEIFDFFGPAWEKRQIEKRLANRRNSNKNI